MWAQRRLLSTALLLLISVSQAQAPAPARVAGRALPLNRFPVSRHVQTDAEGFFQMAFAIGDDYFDGNDSRARVRRHLSVARQIGAKYLRCAFSWNGIEPQEGKYNFAFWDMLIDEASRAGVQVIPYVAYTPEWAARKKEQFWEQPPRDPSMFANVMKQLATRYRGKIKSWELWNEPDLPEYWQGTPAEFAEMIQAGATAVREADPNAVLVLGGMSHGPAEFFSELMNKHEIYRWVDVIAMHGYPESWDEDRAETVYASRVAKMQSFITESKQPLDLWLNELGYADYRFEAAHASGWGTNVYYRYEHTPKYSAEFLFKSLALAIASGDPSLAGWYRIDDFRHTDPRMPEDKVHYHLGLIDVNGKPKPTFYAMKFVSRLLQRPVRMAGDRLRVRAQENTQSVIHLFERKDGKLVLTAWLRSSNYYEVRTHTGMAQDARRETISVTLPCTPKYVWQFSGTGALLATRTLPSTELKNIPLRGDRVYIAEVQCR